MPTDSYAELPPRKTYSLNTYRIPIVVRCDSVDNSIFPSIVVKVDWAFRNEASNQDSDLFDHRGLNQRRNRKTCGSSHQQPKPCSLTLQMRKRTEGGCPAHGARSTSPSFVLHAYSGQVNRSLNSASPNTPTTQSQNRKQGHRRRFRNRRESKIRNKLVRRSVVTGTRCKPDIGGGTIDD